MKTVRTELANRRLHILPYKLGSVSAKLLRDELQQYARRDVLLLEPGSKWFDPAHARIGSILNWGYSDKLPIKVYNSTDTVACCVNKVHTAHALAQHGTVPAPRYTESPDEASGWLAEGKTVVARHVLTGHSGQGVQVISNDGELFRAKDVKAGSWLKAKLFTEYFQKSQEFRVFVFKEKHPDPRYPYKCTARLVRRKRKRNGIEEEGYTKYVRNHGNGWVFCQQDLATAPAAVKAAAESAAYAVNADFCAVDVGYNVQKDTACVFEINTAPGLEGETVKEVAKYLLDVVLI